MGALKDTLLKKSYTRLNHIAERMPSECQSSSLYPTLMKLDMNTGARLSGNSLEVSESKFKKYYFDQKGDVGLDNTDWRNAPWIMFSGDTSLFSDPAFLKDYKNRLLTHRKRTEINSLMASYFANFDEDSKDIKFAGSLITELISKDARFDSWAIKHKAISIFSPELVLGNLVSNLYENNSTLADTLIEAGLVISSNDNYTQFLGAVHKKLCLEVANRKQFSREKILELMQWSRLDAHIRYQKNKADLLDALLIPWLDKTPEEDLKNMIFDFVLKYYKDPRMFKANWVGCSAIAEKVFLGWLTEKSLEQFFSIVDGVAQQSHWDYRRKFWEAYKGYDMQVWVVFGPVCARKSKAIYGDELSFATFSNMSGIKDSHACLIIKLGNLIITEWSDNGACRIWDMDDPQAPRMYLKKYDPNKLKAIQMGDPRWFRHGSSESYSWQRNISKFIYRKTNIKLMQMDYRI